MNQREPIAISDSDSDCRIDEARSGPRRTAPSVSRAAPSTRQPSFAPAQNRLSAFRPNQQPDHVIGAAPKRQPVPSNVRGVSGPTKVSPQLPDIRAVPAETKKSSVNPVWPQTNSTEYAERRRAGRQDIRCTYCTLDNECCDGGSPCACCFERGFACAYPGQDPVISSQAQIINTIESSRNRRASSSEDTSDSSRNHLSNSDDESSENTSKDSMTERALGHAKAIPVVTKSDSNLVSAQHVENFAISDQSRKSQSSKYRSHERMMDLDDERTELKSCRNSHIDDNDSSSPVMGLKTIEIESIPSTSWLPTCLEDVQRLIHAHEANMASHREYIVEAQLADAKVKSQRNLHTAVASGVNPFIKMIAAKAENGSTSSLPASLSLNIKTRRGGHPNMRVAVQALGESLAAHIPDYKSIGRLRSPFLVRNKHMLKFIPYQANIADEDLDQRRHDVETYFKEGKLEQVRKQRECLESVYQWSEDFDEILAELHLTKQKIRSWLTQNGKLRCKRCETSHGHATFSKLSVVELSKAEKKRCSWLDEAFTEITGLGMWHFVTSRPGQIERRQDAITDQQIAGDKSEQMLCSLCFTHNCLTHGSFLDNGPLNKKNRATGEAIINDNEEQHNERQKATLRCTGRKLSPHICGLYCFENRDSVVLFPQKIIGLDEDGLLNGLRNENVSMLQDLGSFRSNKACTQKCFLWKKSRTAAWNHGKNESFRKAPISTQKLISSLSKLYSSNLRLPCMIAKSTGLQCMTAFFLLLEAINTEHVIAEQDHHETLAETLLRHKNPGKSADYATSRSSKLDLRKTWVPCSHQGPCRSGLTDCACARDDVHCEISCGCADNCKRRFRGCSCKKACFMNSSCECYAANRECDPMLCHSCGVEEVLDPSNKYRDDVRRGRCNNNRLQLDLPPRTYKGMSEVQGWGLFLGEDLPANSFVGEYRGENISQLEGNRRGAIYAYVGQEYLFTLNIDHELDGSRFGNKTRFINNSTSQEFINVVPRVMLVSGVTRVGLFTCRAIKAGEELLYNYGYPQAVVEKEFWEKHERTIEQNGVITPIPKPKFRNRAARIAGTPRTVEVERNHGHGIKEASPSKKRRRRMEEISADSDEDRIETNGGSALEVDDTEYAESDQESESPSRSSGRENGDAEAEESEESDEEPIKKHTDRRYGGEAQRKAALKRKMNQQLRQQQEMQQKIQQKKRAR